jgi:YesN/AraC family two-component response regulator
VSRLRVLIVDDEPAARDRLRRLLADAPVDVVGEAADGLQALDLVARERPDVILLDISMPEITGLDVARRLPARRRRRSSSFRPRTTRSPSRRSSARRSTIF